MRQLLELAIRMAVQTAAAWGDGDGEGPIAAVDRCPDEPEDLDGYQDEDGCPDRDNDGDGILDAVRYVDGAWITDDCMVENGRHVDCRNLAEDVDGFEDKDGCPDLVCTMPACEFAFTEFVHYDAQGRFDRAAEESFSRVVEGLRSYPETWVMIGVRVYGEPGDERALKRSDRMAAKVVKALVRRGVARERLVPTTILYPPSDGRAWGRIIDLRAKCESSYYQRPELPPGQQCGPR